MDAQNGGCGAVDGGSGWRVERSGRLVGGEVVGGAGGVGGFGPAGGDHLAAGVEGDAFRAVDVLVAEQRGLPAAEGVVGHRHGQRHVDADHAHGDGALELPGRGAGGGEDRGAVAVGVGVDQGDAGVEVLHPDHDEDGAEDFLGVGGHLGLDVVQDGGADPEAVLVAGDHEVAAVHHHGGAGGFGFGDDPDDAFLGRRGDDRAHFGVGHGAVVDLDGQGALLDLLDQQVGGLADGDGDRDGHAAFAGGAEGGGGEVVGGVVEVGVGQDDRVVLRPAQGLDALAVRGGGLVDVLGDRGGADEGDAVHVRVGQEAVDGFLVAVQDLEDAVGQAGLLPQLGQQHRGGGVALGGLEDEGVAGGDRHRRHPQRHHDREVERGDAGDDAERLAEGEDVDPGGDLVRVVALEQLRDAAGELDDLQAAADLALGVGEDLAVLGGDQFGELVHVGRDEFAELEQHGGALGQGDVAPGIGGGAGGGDGGVQVCPVGQPQLRGDGAGGGVVDGLGAGALAGGFGAVDEVADGGGDGRR